MRQQPGRGILLRKSAFCAIIINKNTPDIISMPKIKHGQYGNKKPSGAWCSWTSMIRRYKWRDGYKERGIYEGWIGEDGFNNFFADMGERPEGMTIERIDNNKGYYPENCKWATAKEQENNRSNNNRIEYKGETKTITQWSEQYGISHQTLRHRLNKRGMTMDEALTSPKLYGYNTRR